MSDRLLGIAADVLRSFGSAFGGQHLAIVGGAVPGLLVPNPPPGIPAHVGTGDLDFHLSLHLLDGETADYYDSIIEGLRSLGLAPDARDGRTRKWRWVGTHRNVALQVEFLCPSRTRPGRPEAPGTGTNAEVNIGPQDAIAALALRFGHLVPKDTVAVPRRVETSRGWLTYDFPVAGLTSWLCLKSDAIANRDKPKDAYDVVWVINALGPDRAATMVAGSPLLGEPDNTEVASQLRLLTQDEFRDIESVWPRAYADFLGETSGAVHLRHAQATLAEFRRALDLNGVA